MLKCKIYVIMYIVLFSTFKVNKPNNIDLRPCKTGL